MVRLDQMGPDLERRLGKDCCIQTSCLVESLGVDLQRPLLAVGDVQRFHGEGWRKLCFWGRVLFSWDWVWKIEAQFYEILRNLMAHVP